MSQLSVYVAGPMRGLPGYNFPAFDEAAERLTSEGWLVHSPAEHDRSLGFDPSGPPPDAEDLAEMHRWDMGSIAESDAICLLPGWEQSDGATREFDVAKACGLEVLYWPDTRHVEPPKTHWTGTSWVEPPDGEAAPPHPPLAGWSEIDSELCAGIAPKPTVSTHAFNRAVDSTLNRCLLISNQRGGEYQDTWSEANLRTAFLDATLRGISEQQGHHGTDVELIALTPAEKRLLIVAAMVDVKLSRMIGPWKDDTVLDAINYLAAYAAWMGEYLGEEA